MKWLNYHHLLYFWTVAREGSIAAACEELRLAQPTVSSQIRTLEKSLGQKLFRHVGRRLALTEVGQLVYRYANDIFSLGHEMMQTLDGHPEGSRQQLRVGVADVLPKMAVCRALTPALEISEAVQVVCFEGKPRELLARLSVHELDIVLSDSPIGSDVSVKAYNHLLGESDISFFGPRDQAKRWGRFPKSLNGARFVLPTPNTSMRRMLDYWFLQNDVHPNVIAEFEDSALLKAFGDAQGALFPAPTIIRREVERLYDVSVVGRVEDVKEKFYAISLERRVKHPAVIAIVESAHRDLFSQSNGAAETADGCVGERAAELVGSV